MYEPLEEALGIHFQNQELLNLALTHRSYIFETPGEGRSSNERLEFLGDSILAFVSADFLYRTFPELSEGELSDLRAALVKTETLASFARDIQLGKYLLLGRGEHQTGGSQRVLASAFEAILGAIYLDQGIEAADIPVVTDDDGTQVRLVCGTFWGETGPVDGVATDPIYIDVSVPPGLRKTLPIETTRHAFAYVFAGSGKFCNASGPLEVPTEPVSWADTNPPAAAENRSLVLFDRGDEVMVQAGDDGIRFLLVSGKPLQEPVAWYGPIVMNTQEELRHAFQQLDEGTFLRPDARR